MGRKFLCLVFRSILRGILDVGLLVHGMLGGC